MQKPQHSKRNAEETAKALLKKGVVRALNNLRKQTLALFSNAVRNIVSLCQKAATTELKQAQALNEMAAQRAAPFSAAREPS